MKQIKTLTNMLFVLYLVCAISQGVLSVALSDILREYAVKDTQQGLLNAGAQFGSLFSFLLIPLLQSKTGRAAILVSGMALSCVMIAVSGFSASFLLLLLSILMYNVGQGFIDAAINAILIDVEPGKSTRRINRLHMFYAVGATVSPLFLNRILTLYGWRALYLITAALFFLTMVSVLFCLYPLRALPLLSAVRDRVSPVKGFLRIIRNRRNLLTIAALMFYHAVQYSLVNWIYVYLTEDMRVSGDRAAFALTLLWAGIIISRLLVSHSSLRPLRALCTGLFAALPLYFCCIAWGGYAWICAMTFLFGLLCGHGIPTLTARMGLNSPENTISAISVSSLCTGVFSILWPLLIATLRGIFSLRLALCASCFPLLGAAVCLWELNKLCGGETALTGAARSSAGASHNE